MSNNPQIYAAKTLAHRTYSCGPSCRFMDELSYQFINPVSGDEADGNRHDEIGSWNLLELLIFCIIHSSVSLYATCYSPTIYRSLYSTIQECRVWNCNGPKRSSTNFILFICRFLFLELNNLLLDDVILYEYHTIFI